MTAVEATKPTEVSAAQRGAICPRIQSIIPIEDAPRAFEDAASAGVVVVRVS